MTKKGWSTVRAGFIAFVLLTACLTAAPAQASSRCPSQINEPANGQAAITALGPDIADTAADAGMTTAQLKRTLREDSTLWVDMCGRAFYVEPLPPTSPPQETLAADPQPATADAFTLHSRPGSKRTIYLDFDGYDTTGGPWAYDYGSFTAPPYSMDATPTFSATEKAEITKIWQRVSEDFAPFDVDVTTQTPTAAAINRNSVADDVYGTAVAILGTNPIGDSCGCGGLGYVDVFDSVTTLTSVHDYALVFTQGGGTDAKYIAEVASHEAGHNLSLNHDGQAGGVEYYEGQGLWAPIMGAGYYRPLAQWSKGEYSNASNTEDDLARMTSSGIPYAADDVGSVKNAAQALTPGTVSRVIGQPTDEDWFTFTTSGNTTLSLTPAAQSPNLDAEITLYDSVNTQVATANPLSAMVSQDVASGLGASISQSLTNGTYWLRVRGTGAGTPTSTGYSTYGSLGGYDLTYTTVGAPTLAAASLPEVTKGTPYSTTLTATGGTIPYGFSLVSGALPQGLALSSAGTVSGSPSSAGTATFTVRVTDAKNGTASRQFTIVTYSPPTLSGTLPDAVAQSSYSATIAAAEGAAPFTYSVVAGSLPAGLTLSSAGALSGTPQTPGTATFTAKVTDAKAGTATKAFTLTVLPELEVSAQAPPRGTVGSPYSASLKATGGVGPYTWQATGLPPGLTLSDSGQLTGKPDSPGMSTPTITVTDAGGRSASRALSISVIAPLTLTSSAVPSALAGTPYAQTLNATGGTPPYSWTAAGLPQGLSMSPAGDLGGTPTQTGTSDIPVTVTDADSTRVTGTITITVTAPGINLAGKRLPPATKGVRYKTRLTALAATSWSATGLPPGLRMKTNGTLTGNPKRSGRFRLKVTATGQWGQTATASFRLRVRTP